MSWGVEGISGVVNGWYDRDPKVCEQAIFILRTDGGGVSSQQLVDQAVRIAKNYARCQGLPRRRVRVPGWLWAAIGAAAIGLTWLLCTLF